MADIGVGDSSLLGDTLAVGYGDDLATKGVVLRSSKFLHDGVRHGDQRHGVGNDSHEEGAEAAGSELVEDLTCCRRGVEGIDRACVGSRSYCALLDRGCRGNRCQAKSHSKEGRVLHSE